LLLLFCILIQELSFHAASQPLYKAFPMEQGRETVLDKNT